MADREKLDRLIDLLKSEPNEDAFLKKIAEAIKENEIELTEEINQEIEAIRLKIRNEMQ
ncbi:MAG: hypothetical protein H6561_18825 [Lewinellaceae bacterium]|nr:hypothetical protein [Saprospiraceae bacterium]MCB9271586.1 hypothetical protein [Lewinellaceae bacterium]HPG06690.1 hypothetical protein [Saprospiraceae bacterium]HPR59135.1 hypothetical protein [Bacteroidales bacterium]HQU54717.1 hypothetical protein [Saprospiraceae bacterium]